MCLDLHFSCSGIFKYHKGRGTKPDVIVKMKLLLFLMSQDLDFSIANQLERKER